MKDKYYVQNYFQAKIDKQIAIIMGLWALGTILIWAILPYIK